MRKCTALLLLLAFGTPSAAACTLVPQPPRSPAAIEKEARDWHKTASDLVELRMVETATFEGDGRAVVLRSATGKVRPGTFVSITTMPGSTCGSGDAQAGFVYRMYLRGPEPYFFAPMGIDQQRKLHSLGLIPRGWKIAG